MKNFDGFPQRMRFTPIPNLFFTAVLPQIEDLAEAKTTLHLFWTLYQKKGYPRFATYGELATDALLMSGLGEGELRRSLEGAVARGTLLHLALERDGGIEDLYFLNTETDRRAVARIVSGELQIGTLAREEPTGERERPNIFTLYEENIGMLTPMIAEELKEAEGHYPASWIEDAFREAVSLNKRSWRYICRILERWSEQGKDDGEPRRDSKAHYPPGEYLRRYGHLLRK